MKSILLKKKKINKETGKGKTFMQKLNIKELRKANTKLPKGKISSVPKSKPPMLDSKGRPTIDAIFKDIKPTLMSEIRKRIGVNRKTKNKKKYKAGRR